MTSKTILLLYVSRHQSYRISLTLIDPVPFLGSSLLNISDVAESSLSSQSHKPFESETSQSWVARTIEPLQVIDLQARVNVESN